MNETRNERKKCEYQKIPRKVYVILTLCLDYHFKRTLINIKCVQICQWGSARVECMPLNNTIRISCRLRALPPIGVLLNRHRHCECNSYRIFSVFFPMVRGWESKLFAYAVLNEKKNVRKNSGENGFNSRHHTSDNNKLLWEYST